MITVSKGTLRLVIFLVWLISFLVAEIAVLVSPFRVPEITSRQAADACWMIAPIWVPVLTCMATIWFGKAARKASRAQAISNEHVIAAISSTFAYLLLVVFSIIYYTYLLDYSNYTGPTLPRVDSFDGHIEFCLKFATLLGPLGTAPALWLAGSRTRSPELPRRNEVPVRADP